MKVEIVMPKMGESITEGTIIKWHKKVGDEVKQDETLLEISTDKVDSEVPSSESGVLVEIKVEEGETVEVGEVVAVVETEGSSAVVEKDKEKETPSSEDTDTEDTSEEQTDNAPSDDVTDIEMPKMGESITEGTILRWFKKKGEKIEAEEPLFEISTDKVDTEVPSPVAGVLVEILVNEQETVEVGTVVARISASGKVPAASKSKDEASMHDAVAKAAANERDTEIKTADVKPDKADIPEGRFYSPLVLNIASQEGISMDELNSIKGSGANGRVTKKDILAYLEKRESAPKQKAAVREEKTPVAKPAPAAQPDMSWAKGGVEVIPMDNVRQKIMEHMVNSRDTSVHVTGLIEVDMTKIQKFMDEHKAAILKNEGVKLTYMAFIAHACIRALKEHPLVNATIEGSKILKKKFVNLGIAVAMEPNGLIVPNIKNAQNYNITGLAGAVSDAAHRARNRKLTPDDISGGTFTITNYGVFGTIFGTPIINQPEVAILGVGAVVKKPVVVTVDGIDTIAIKPIMALTLSHDHRLVDGMLGGLFLKSVKDKLEAFNEDIFM